MVSEQRYHQKWRFYIVQNVKIVNKYSSQAQAENHSIKKRKKYSKTKKKTKNCLALDNEVYNNRRHLINKIHSETKHLALPAPKRAREATAIDLKPGRDSDAPSPHLIQLLDRLIGDKL